MAQGVRVSDEVREEIRNYVSKGNAQVAAAEHFGLHPMTIHYICKEGHVDCTHRGGRISTSIPHPIGLESNPDTEEKTAGTLIRIEHKIHAVGQSGWEYQYSPDNDGVIMTKGETRIKFTVSELVTVIKELNELVR